MSMAFMAFFLKCILTITFTHVYASTVKPFGPKTESCFSHQLNKMLKCHKNGIIFFINKIATKIG